MTPENQPEEVIRRKFSELSPYLDERTRRMWAATEAHELGFGGVGISGPGDWADPEYCGRWRPSIRP